MYIHVRRLKDLVALAIRSLEFCKTGSLEREPGSFLSYLINDSICHFLHLFIHTACILCSTYGSVCGYSDGLFESIENQLDYKVIGSESLFDLILMAVQGKRTNSKLQSANQFDF